jgi:beta-lactamase superfamily II metal-dependent hydrolase
MIQSDIIYDMKEQFDTISSGVRSWWKDHGALSFVSILFLCSIFFLWTLIVLCAPQKLRISFLDVGQGDAILIKTPSGHDMLIDGGGGNVVLEKLSHTLSYFDKHLDIVVETHPDADHVTGLIPVLGKYDVDTIVTSPLAGHTGIFDELQRAIDDEKAVVRVGRKGDRIDFGDGVVAHILYPAQNFQKSNQDTNDASVSVLITYGDQSILLTGDLPSTYEGELLGKDLPRHNTIYKAGHHGSKYSSGDQLLSYIRPEYSVISAGKNNTYGHPHAEVMERLSVYSQEVLSTIDKGTINFFLDGHNVRVLYSH